MARRVELFAALLGLLLVGAACTPQAPPVVEEEPELRDPAFSFVALGDFGSRDAAEMAVARAIERWVDAEGADAFVTTGDNVYPNGAPEFFSEAWHQPYGWVTREGLDIVASLGNHDVRFEDGAAVMDLLDMPERHYEVDLDGADLLVLDSTRLSRLGQTRWLLRALQNTDEAWQIAVMHHPPYSCSKHGSTLGIVARWVPWFERHGVDLVLSGHDHNYQRFEERDGVTYVVTGGGGKQLYPVHRCGFLEPDLVAEEDDVHHFLYVEGSRTRLRVRAVAADGTLLDDFTLDA